MAFATPLGLMLGVGVESRRLNVTRRPRACAASTDGEWQASPASLKRAWGTARHAAGVSDLAQRHVSVVLVSWKCERALLAERVFAMHAERRSRSRRLLVHSAGLQVEAGASLGRSILAFAASRGLVAAESQPCARFDPLADFEFYDLVLAMDRGVMQRLHTLAEAAAGRVDAGVNLADWERKIRLLADFEGALESRMDVDNDGNRPRRSSPIDVPLLSNDAHRALDIMHGASASILDTLIAKGL